MSAIITEGGGSCFMVPSYIVKRYINSSSHADLKLLLWLLSAGNDTAEKEDICRLLNFDKEQLEDSLKYWCDERVLIKRGAKYSVNLMLTAFDIPAEYSGEAIAKKVAEDPGIAKLLAEICELTGRLLSNSEASIIINLCDYGGMRPEVVASAASYCVENGKKGIRYIEKTSAGWNAQGIDTEQKAERYINEQREKKSVSGKIVKMIGASDRALTENEKKSIDQWAVQFSDLDIIKKAYDITVENTGKYTLSYMNRILSNWNEKGYKKIGDIKEDKPAKTAAKKGERNYEATFKNSWKIIHKE